MNLKLKYIEKQYTLTSDMYFGLYGLLVVLILTGLTANATGQNGIIGVGAMAAVLIIIYTISVHVYIGRLLQQRSDALMELAAEHKWDYEAQPNLDPVLGDSSLLMLANRDLTYKNGIKTDDWIYGDLSYSVYQQTKYGEYKAATIYYATMAVQLPRVLPNVLFDSKNAKGRKRQFKRKFAKDELHHLEGNFDNYFDTYFAEGYTIDSMSFITPDVMETLIDAAEYDIEIVRDKLLMYGPMLEGAGQISDMSGKLIAIKNQLMNNVKAYDDERLPGAEGRQAVTPQGMFLKRRQAHAWMSVVAIVVYVIIRIVASQQH